MSREQDDRGLSTADLVAATETAAPAREDASQVTQVETRGSSDARNDARNDARTDARDARPAAASGQEQEQLAALFPPDIAGDFQSRWDAVQIGFVDDPQQAVRKADELVAQVMKSLAQSFASERERFESQLGQNNDSASTENMRVALRRYRSFFQRLLSL